MSIPARKDVRSTTTVADRRWRLAALILGLIIMNLGCGPQTLFFLLPFPDPTFPPEFSLIKPEKKDPKVVIMVAHAQLQTNSDLQFSDRELEEALIKQLTERYKVNKEKVTLIPSFKVREYKSRHTDWKSRSPFEIGKDLKADYVINVEINKISLYEKGSINTLYRGRAEIFVSVTDVNGPEEQGPVFTKDYVAQYPGTGPEPTDYSINIFRTRFINRMARDMSCFFAAYPTDRKMDMD